MITLTDGTDTVTLPDDVRWADEFSWHPVEQKAEQTITGALVVQIAARLAGRPFTLESGDNFAWLTRAQLDILTAWAAIPGKQMTLNIRGGVHVVIFDHQGGQALRAEMVLYHAAPVPADYYVCTVRLLEI